MKNDFRIVYMGTPDFAVESLKLLCENHYNIVGVITVPDKPAGRGQKISESPVKKYALQKGLDIMQPEKLKSHSLVNTLKKMKPDLFVVVAFRMLPDVIWSIPKEGTINLHASKLPDYRGAAPINWPIINGEKSTGISTFFIDYKIDTGNIIMQEDVEIGHEMNAGELHDELMHRGAELMLKTVEAIRNKSFQTTKQEELLSKTGSLKTAPKIFKKDCLINWNLKMDTIHDFIRGLSPYPAAFTLLNDQKKSSFKIFRAKKLDSEHQFECGKIVCDQKKEIKVACKDGFIQIHEIQMAGKKKLAVEEFLKGYHFEEDAKFIQ